MNHEILSRLTFPTSADAALKIALSFVFLIRIRLFQTIHNYVIVLTKTKDVLKGILKENVHLMVGDWMRYACLTANSLLSVLAAVVAVSLCHS